MSKIEDQVKDLTAFNADLTAGAIKSAMEGNKSSDLYGVPIDQFQVLPDYNPRIVTDEYVKGLHELAKSMAEHGWYRSKPMAAYVAAVKGENVVYVEDGHRRLAAAKLANSEYGASIEVAPTVIMSRAMTVEERLEHMVRSNQDGVPFNALEQAIVAARFEKFGKTEEQIASILHVSVPRVKQLLVLAGSPKEIRDWVKSGEISATLAIETVQTQKDNAVPAIKKGLEKAKKAGKRMTAKQLEEQVEKPSAKQKKYALEAYILLRRVFNSHIGKTLKPELQKEWAELAEKSETI